MLALDQRRNVLTGVLLGTLIGLQKLQYYAQTAELDGPVKELESLGNMVLLIGTEVLLKIEGRNTCGWPRIGIFSTMVGLPLVAYASQFYFKAISSVAIAIILGKRIIDSMHLPDT